VLHAVGLAGGAQALGRPRLAVAVRRRVDRRERGLVVADRPRAQEGEGPGADRGGEGLRVARDVGGFLRAGRPQVRPARPEGA